MGAIMMNNMHIIAEITPYYNAYTKEQKPVECIVKMWEIGKILDHHIITTGMKPHTLFRDLYGKSETSVNTQQKSYISREFQGRCYRVYHMFQDISEIRENFKNLKSITIFREAMPFFDNPKYKIDRDKLYVLLASDLPNTKILQEIKKMQSTIIGKKNPRTQRLHEMDKEVDTFRNFYTYVLSYIRMRNYHNSQEQFLSDTELEISSIKELARNTEQLVLTNVQHSPIKFETRSEITLEYIKMIEELLAPSNIKKIRRFRRLVNSRYVLLLTDMLYAICDEDGYNSLVKKLH